MKATIGKFFKTVGNFFSGSDRIPWCDSSHIAGFEKMVAEAEKGSSDEVRIGCLIRLSLALVHSKRPENVQRGLGMLEGLSTSAREKIYLLAVGYYRSGDYSRSSEYVERCLMMYPDWGQPKILKKAIEERIKKDGVIGIGIAVTAAGLLAGGIAAALARKK